MLIRCLPLVVLLAVPRWASAQPDQEAAPLAPLVRELLSAAPEARARLLEQHEGEVGLEQIQALLDEGARQREANELSAALAAFELARDVADHAKLPKQSGLTRRGLAQMLSAFGRYQEARAELNTARAIFAQAGETELEVRCLLNLGIVARYAGDPEAALEAYAEGGARAQALGSERLVAVALNNSAVVHLSRGDQRSALEALDRALELSGDDRQLRADVFANLGLVHTQQGNHELAVDYLQRSLGLQRELGNTFGSINEHANLGYAFLALRRLEEARVAFAESAALADKGGVPNLGARAHVGLGQTLVELEKLEAAAAEAKSALLLARASNTPDALAQALIFSSDLDARRGQPQTALASAREAGALADAAHSRLRSRAREAEGRALELLGRADEARAAYESAIAAIEEQRQTVAGGEIERQSFLEQRVGPYERLLGLLAGQGQAEPALVQAERAKARALIDALSGARMALDSVLDPAERERERDLREALARDNAGFERERGARAPDKARLAAAEERLQTARRTYEGLRASLYASHPELRARSGDLPVFEPAQARQLLDAQTLVLEYAVTDERTYLFSLAREGPARLHVLPTGRRALEGSTRRFREQLAARDLGLRASARELCQTLLGPARAELGRYRRLLLVPDGPLWELPFQALECRPGRYLLDDHALALAPSLTALREMSRRAARPRPAGGLLALGNPAVGEAAQRRASSLYRDATLGPLPAAEAEVRALGKLYGPESAVYVGAQAREDRLKAEAKGHSVLHLAAHGILDDHSPLYSHLALASPEKGAGEDGRLEAWELMDLELNADLAVLSACESGRGHVGRGEGLIGLSWAFFVAGCPTTVVSQWKVDSESTSKLMLAFHKRLAAGEPKAEALQAAALALRRDPRYAHPFYWAPFIVVGAGLGAPAR